MSIRRHRPTPPPTTQQDDDTPMVRPWTMCTEGTSELDIHDWRIWSLETRGGTALVLWYCTRCRQLESRTEPIYPA